MKPGSPTSRKLKSQESRDTWPWAFIRLSRVSQPERIDGQRRTAAVPTARATLPLLTQISALRAHHDLIYVRGTRSLHFFSSEH